MRRKTKSAFLCLLLLVACYQPVFGADSREQLGGDFALLDHNSQPFQLNQLRGKVVLLFFGYTYCPDICPTELTSIAALLTSFNEQSDAIQALFVSVDPERDTAEKLKEYVRFFSPNLIGLTGSIERIEAVKKRYGVRSTINKTDGDSIHYSVDHTANLYVIDQTGTLVSIVPYGFPISHVKAVVDRLLAPN